MEGQARTNEEFYPTLILCLWKTTWPSTHYDCEHVALATCLQIVMSSGFVSGGIAGEEVKRDDEWKNAQRQVEEARRAKEDLARQHDGKSLFEILQANKDKKQAEFEERARFQLHNALDDDEADYLDSVLEKKRREEDRVRKETIEQLDLFRRQQEEAESKALGDEPDVVPEDERVQWAATGKKRKKGLEAGLLKGAKLSKPSARTIGKHAHDEAAQATNHTPTVATREPWRAISERNSSNSMTPSGITAKPAHAASSAKTSNALSLGLGYASSDDED